MAYTTPHTWASGEKPTAAQMNQEVRDNLNAAFPLGVDAWTSYTPTLTQSGAVTKTVTYAKYQRIGRLIVFQVNLAATGAGTGGNAVLVGLPVTAAVNTAHIINIGQGHIFDQSAGLLYKGVSQIFSNVTAQLRPTSTTANDILGSGVFTAALAAGDEISVSGMYEAAT